MKKSNFIALILGTIGGIFFALGMCTALLPEWGMSGQGIAAGIAGLLLLLLDLIIWRRMEGKAPVKTEQKDSRRRRRKHFRGAPSRHRYVSDDASGKDGSRNSNRARRNYPAAHADSLVKGIHG